jgi:DNA-binding NarL/FixJ family response regulator
LLEILWKQGEIRMGRVAALIDDLFFQLKVAETAKQLGIEFKVASNPDALFTLLEPPTRLVIVDLNSRNQPVATIEKLRATQKELRVVAFLSHVQTELAAQARAAGCLEVMPRSVFTQNLAAILQAAKD